MINAEKLLGAFLKQGLRSGRRRSRRRRRRRSGLGSLLGGSALTGAAGVGLLGVAIAAYEHFTKKDTPPQGPNPYAGGGTGFPPPSTSPPPPPGQPSAGPPPPPPGAAPDPKQSKEALLLLRAMIAAANADGAIDEDERQHILGKLAEAGMTDEERQFVLTQFADPPTLDSLLSDVNSPELARQIYAVSLLAVEVDSEAEREYLATLQKRLKLDDSVVRQLHEEFDEPLP